MYTIKEVSKGFYEEKNSKFRAFLVPLGEGEKPSEVARYYKKVYDKAFGEIRHTCWASHSIEGNYQNSSNSEVGSPGLKLQKSIEGIRGAIIIVLRWYGGIDLGANNVGRAYLKAAEDAISNATLIKHLQLYTLSNIGPSDYGRALRYIQLSGGEIVEKGVDWIKANLDPDQLRLPKAKGWI